jgi:signal transduction histidine kinase
MSLPSPERLTVARELHDGLAQDLVGIGYSLDILLAHESLDRVARQLIRETRLHVDGVIAKVRNELLNLRSPESISLVSQIEELTQSILGDISCSLQLEELHVSSEISITSFWRYQPKSYAI